MVFPLHIRRILPYFPAICSGLMLTAAFPDVHLFPLAFAALVPLLVSLDGLTRKQGFLAGFFTGTVHYLTLIYWIVPTLCTYGGLHLVLALSCLVLLSLYLALFPALFAWLLKRIDPGPVLMPLACAGLWTGLELARTHLLTGFSWGVLGYSQTPNLYLLQCADVAGVLGISFIIVLCNAALALVVRFVRNRTGISRARLTAALACPVLIPALAVAYGFFRIPEVERLMASAPSPRLSIVQGNIRQDLKWSDAFKHNTVEKYGTLSLASSRQNPDLIIWPETALPFYYGHNRELSDLVDQWVRKSGTHLLMGSPAAEINGNDIRYFNRVYLLDRMALVRGTYDKTHLVPFGEYVPLENLLVFIQKLTQEAGNFTPGNSGFIPLPFKAHKTGVLICFEILFPDISVAFVRNGADLLTTVTNDAWFGRTAAARQHVAIAVLRAVENRRSLARAANTGISGFIDPVGRISDATPLFADAVVTRAVPALTTLSVYTRYPHLAPLASLVAIFAVFMVKGIQNIKRRESS